MDLFYSFIYPLIIDYKLDFPNDKIKRIEMPMIHQMLDITKKLDDIYEHGTINLLYWSYVLFIMDNLQKLHENRIKMSNYWSNMNYAEVDLNKEYNNINKLANIINHLKQKIYEKVIINY